MQLSPGTALVVAMAPAHNNSPASAADSPADVILPLNIKAQGGRITPAVAIGRMGSQLLVVYSTKGGLGRKRWLPASRCLDIRGDVDTLPVYAARTCPATKFDTPRVFRAEDSAAEWRAFEDHYRNARCHTCGGVHKLDVRRGEYRIFPRSAAGFIAGQDLTVRGLRSRKLDPARVDA